MDSNVKLYEVSNLSEYISLLKELKANVGFFRGESSFYPERIASAFRPFKNKFPLFNFEEIVFMFYREVYSKITENDKSHFMAFAQHHWIPTNLIDITYNPLSALWFACDGGNADDFGCVYCFDDNYIDITEFVEEKFVGFDLLHNLFKVPDDGKLISSQRDLLLCLITNPQFYINYRKVLNNVKKAILTGEQGKTSPDVYYVYQESEIREIEELLCEMEALEIKNIDPNKSNLVTNDEVYLFQQIHRLFPITVFTMLYGIVPNLLYNPILSFERAVKQSGCFLYQAYKYHSFPMVNTINDGTLQKINVFSIIKINNKPDIIAELDGIGINRKTIYADFDNIAKYIVDRFKEGYSEMKCCSTESENP